MSVYLYEILCILVISDRQQFSLELMLLFLGNTDNMHPIQKLMVDTHAVQCGYDSPGMMRQGRQSFLFLGK